MKTPIKIWIHGISGRMGELLCKEAKADGAFEIIGGSGKGVTGEWRQGQLQPTEKSPESLLTQADVVLDFSSIEGTQTLIDSMNSLKGKAPAVLLAVTGLTQKQYEKWRATAKAKNFALLEAPNTSLGVFLVLQSAVKMAKVLCPLGYDIEIVETHHRDKKDAPSGTAKLLAETLAKAVDKTTIYGRAKDRQKNEIGIAALRGGAVFGEHSIRFLGDYEEIELTHKALSRDLFAKSALRLSGWLGKQEAGCYEISDLDLEQFC